MNYRILDMCRGNGKGYVKLLARKTSAARLYASATAENGRELVCAVYEMPRDGEDLGVSMRHGSDAQSYGEHARLFVVAVPLLDGTDLSVRVFDSESADSPVFVFPFKPMESKFRSRMLYKRHPDRAMQIRDIDQRRLSGQPYVYVTGIYYLTPTEVVCRFHATIPYEPGAQYEAFVVDANAEPVGTNLVVLEDSVVPDPHDSDMQLMETGYSVRLKKTEKVFCINVIAQNSLIARGCFTCLQSNDVVGFINGSRNELRHASQDPEYPHWLERHRATPDDLLRQRGLCKVWSQHPLISVITPVFRTPEPYLRAMIASVLAQSYSWFELILVNVSGPCSSVDNVLAELHDNRIHVITAENMSIAENTNIGINASSGEYIVFVDHDDIIEPDAFYRYMSMTREYPQTDLLYCDEDHLKDDHYEWPTFKPEFNPDLLYTHNYITHMLMVSRHALSQVSLSSAEMSGAQDYDLTLKCSEVARGIRNVPFVLYHWREHDGSTSVAIENKPYAIEAGKRALKAHFSRLHLETTIDDRAVPCTYRVTYRIREQPLISIIIPTRDHINLLATCLESILGKTDYKDIEIICVENGSRETKTFNFYSEIQSRSNRVHVVTWRGKGFNYSAICNFGAAQAKGDILLFLNNDTEVITPDWLSSMMNYCVRDDVGVVGAKLFNRDGLVQHAGIWVSPGGCDYLNQNYSSEGTGYMNLLRFPSDVAAVTGACQLVKRSLFESVGGYDEQLAVSFSDVDLCLKVNGKNYYTVFDPDAHLYHRESSSRGKDDVDVKKLRRMEKEKFYFFNKWSSVERGVFVNKNLDQYNGYFKLQF